MDRIDTPTDSDPDMDRMLAQLLAQPSTASQLLTEIAYRLSTRDTSHLAITVALWDEVFAAAHRRIIGDLCHCIAVTAAEHAATALPNVHPDETCGEYALRLRTAAKGLR